jgi:hypothetical protein
MSLSVSTANWDEIQARLEARRGEINAEISAYPGPITGCDAQFNHLTGQRSAINRELARLNEMREKDGPDAVTDFIAACPFLSSEEFQT